MMSSSEAINYKWRSKTGWGHPRFQLSEKKMEILRDVLFAIETEEKKTEFNFFT